MLKIIDHKTVSLTPEQYAEKCSIEELFQLNHAVKKAIQKRHKEIKIYSLEIITGFKQKEMQKPHEAMDQLKAKQHNN